MIILIRIRPASGLVKDERNGPILGAMGEDVGLARGTHIKTLIIALTMITPPYAVDLADPLSRPPAVLLRSSQHY